MSLCTLEASVISILKIICNKWLIWIAERFTPSLCVPKDRLYGLVLRVPGYRSRSPRFDSRRYQIFWKVVGLQQAPPSLVRIIEELLERKVAAPVYKTKINGRGDSFRWPRDTLYPLKSALTLPTSGGSSVGIVCWRTKALEFFSMCTQNLYTRKYQYCHKHCFHYILHSKEPSWQYKHGLWDKTSASSVS
jgi:hypothetical protein